MTVSIQINMILLKIKSENHVLSLRNTAFILLFVIVLKKRSRLTVFSTNK